MSRRRTVKLRIAAILLVAVSSLLGTTLTPTSAFLNDSRALPGNAITTKQTPAAPTISIAPAAGTYLRVAGGGGSSYSGDGGPATSAAFTYPWAPVGDSNGNLYVSDQQACVVRKINASGTISTYAGTGTCGFSGDGGQATSAQLNSPQWMAVDTLGNLYIGDSSNYRIRKVNVATGVITTIAGGGGGNGTANGILATSDSLNGYPAGVGVDAQGNVYYGQLNSKTVRKIDVTTGLVSTVAGNGSTTNNGTGTGDGGPATSATLTPGGLSCMTVAANGDIYICDGYVVRKVTASTGIISTIAGTGVAGYSGDGGPGTSAQVNGVAAISVDAAGNVYFLDQGNYRIRKVDTSGTITTYVGNGQNGILPVNGASRTGSGMFTPKGIWVDPSGNLYYVDIYGNRVSRVSATAPLLTWNGTATYDNLAQSTDPTFTAPANSLPADQSLTSTHQFLDWLAAPGTQYYYRVHSSDKQYAYVVYGFISPWSNTVNWLDVPPTPLLTAASLSSATSVTFSWGSANGATGYNLQRSTDANFTSPTQLLSGSTATSYSDTGLTPGSTYYYRVNARNAAGGGGWSFPVVVTIAPGQTTGLALSAQTTTQMTATWSATSGATSYILDYSTNSNFASSTTLTVTGTSQTITGLTPGTTYYVRVTPVTTALNGGGPGTTSSSVNSPTITGQVTTPTATLAVTTGSAYQAKLNWTAVTGATSYAVRYSTDSTFATGVSTTTSATNSAALTGLTSNAVYYFQVAGVNSAGQGAWSGSVSRQFGMPAPTISNKTTTTATLTWSAVGSANLYRYVQRVYNQSACAAGGTPISTTNSTGTSAVTVGLTGLSSSNYYLWAMQASVDNGTTWSPVGLATPCTQG